MSTVEVIAKILVEGSFRLMEQHSTLVVILAIIGFFCVVSAIGHKIVEGLQFLIYIFLIPILIIISLINKKKRKERIKELNSLFKKRRNK